jgi:hypothetical protein
MMSDANANEEVSGFGNMLDSMYHRTFSLPSLRRLRTLVRIADFYGACPITSYGVLAALPESQILVAHIPHDPIAFLLIARQLRNKVLYKESMVHVAGSWHKYSIGKDTLYNPLSEESQLLELATKAFATILAKVNEAQLRISHYTIDEFNYITKAIVANRVPYHMARRPVTARSFASYYRYLGDDDLRSTIGMSLGSDYFQEAVTEQYARTAVTRIQFALAAVMKRNLIFDINPGLVGGSGLYADTYLCADVPDGDLPWYLEETEW